MRNCFEKQVYSKLWGSAPTAPGSKPLGGSKVNSVFNPSEVDEMNIINSGNSVVKS